MQYELRPFGDGRQRLVPISRGQVNRSYSAFNNHGPYFFGASCVAFFVFAASFIFF